MEGPRTCWEGGIAVPKLCGGVPNDAVVDVPEQQGHRCSITSIVALLLRTVATTSYFGRMLRALAANTTASLRSQMVARFPETVERGVAQTTRPKSFASGRSTTEGRPVFSFPPGRKNKKESIRGPLQGPKMNHNRVQLLTVLY